MPRVPYRPTSVAARPSSVPPPATVKMDCACSAAAASIDRARTSFGARMRGILHSGPMLAALAFVLVHQIDQTIQNAIAQHNIPGAVYHLERGGKVYEKAYGDRALVPQRERMTRDTI